MEGRSRGNCSSSTLHSFRAGQNSQMMRVDGLIVINVILAAIMVGIVAYGPRYRHRDFIRFLFQGATTLFLPILSYVVSNGSSIASSIGTLGQHRTYNFFLPSERRLETLQSSCYAWAHLGLILLWASLVQIIEINTCEIVAADDREGRNIGLPMVLVMQAIWTSYLAANNAIQFDGWFVYTFLFVLALVFAKMVLKYYALEKARRSFALGRNPRLIIGYMEQIQEASQHIGPLPPPLIVSGEDRQPVEKQPHGYCISWMSNKNGIIDVNNDNLVTIDKIWQLDDLLLGSLPRIKDTCFSFSLFKMLRCRFAGYTAAEVRLRETNNFFWHVLLQDSDAERLFGVFEDELSFLHDYYYSSLPISYSKSWLPILSILTSLLTIIYCLLVGLGICIFIIYAGYMQDRDYYRESFIKDGQITCFVWCNNFVETLDQTDGVDKIEVGNILFFDIVPVFVLLALVVLAEIKDSACYVCSNWTKVALICRHVQSRENERQSSPKMQRWVSWVLSCRCRLMRHWDDKMNQCSLLVLHPKKTPAVFLKRLLRLPDNQKKNVKVPASVKVAIVEALKSSNGIQNSCAEVLLRSLQDGSRFLWACRGEGKAADTILVWHIATSILEVRHQQQQQQQARSPAAASDKKIVATHLSRYCAYLVAYVPGLLPDDEPWCKSLYKAVKKDSIRVLAGGVAGADELVTLLNGRSEHEVLKKGAKLGKQLVELSEGEETAWRVLAGFWSWMILSVAPSGRLDEHAEAVARGGELVTLLWAMLMHAGPGPGPASSTDDRV